MPSLLTSKCILSACYRTLVCLNSSSPQVSNPHLPFSLGEVNMSIWKPDASLALLFLAPTWISSLQNALQICHIFPIYILTILWFFQASNHMYFSLLKFHPCFENPDQISQPPVTAPSSPSQDWSWLSQRSYSMCHLLSDYLHYLVQESPGWGHTAHFTEESIFLKFCHTTCTPKHLTSNPTATSTISLNYVKCSLNLTSIIILPKHYINSLWYAHLSSYDICTCMSSI